MTLLVNRGSKMESKAIRLCLSLETIHTRKERRQWQNEECPQDYGDIGQSIGNLAVSNHLHDDGGPVGTRGPWRVRLPW